MPLSISLEPTNPAKTLNSEAEKEFQRELNISFVLWNFFRSHVLATNIDSIRSPSGGLGEILEEYTIKDIWRSFRFFFSVSKYLEGLLFARLVKVSLKFYRLLSNNKSF